MSIVITVNRIVIIKDDDDSGELEIRKKAVDLSDILTFEEDSYFSEHGYKETICILYKDGESFTIIGKYEDFFKIWKKYKDSIKNSIFASNN